MAFTPNLGPKMRLGYVLFGAALVALALLGPLVGWWKLLAGAFGAIVVVEGAAGF